MFYRIFFFIAAFCVFEINADPAEITLNITSFKSKILCDKTEDNIEDNQIQIDEGETINIFVDPVPPLFINYVQCANYDDPNEVFFWNPESIYRKNISVQATPAMTGNWNCSIYLLQGLNLSQSQTVWVNGTTYTAVYCTFKVNVAIETTTLIPTTEASTTDAFTTDAFTTDAYTTDAYTTDAYTTEVTTTDVNTTENPPDCGDKEISMQKEIKKLKEKISIYENYVKKCCYVYDDKDQTDTLVCEVECIENITQASREKRSLPDYIYDLY